MMDDECWSRKIHLLKLKFNLEVLILSLSVPFYATVLSHFSSEGNSVFTSLHLSDREPIVSSYFTHLDFTM